MSICFHVIPYKYDMYIVYILYIYNDYRETFSFPYLIYSQKYYEKLNNNHKTINIKRFLMILII